MSRDHERLKDEQRITWDAVAAGWNRWWRTFEDAAQPVSDRMVELAGIGPGSHVLDIATGLGEPALTAARRVGSDGAVIAVDHAPDMLRLARERAEALGLDNVTFQVRDAEALVFAEATFDAVLCRWGLMFLPDLVGTLTGIRKTLCPGGRFAAAVWSSPESVPMIGVSSRILAERVPLEAPEGLVLGPFRLSEPGALLAAMEEAGFTDVISEHLTVTFTFESPAAYTRFRRDSSTTDARLQGHYPAGTIEAAWQAVSEAAGAFTDAEGRVIMENQVPLVAGAREDA
jgi:ubiquinone/menaquinone biosynthesis C-methylase UbiE